MNAIVRDIGPRHQTVWTEALTAELTRLWGEGIAAGEIARLLTRFSGTSLSKNAITCKAHRLGLSTRASPKLRALQPKPPKAASLGPEVPALGPRRAPGQRRLSRLETVCPGPSGADRFLGVSSLTSAPVAVSNEGAGVAFSELRGSACRWPLWGDERPSEFKFCGCDVAPGRPYCEGHNALARAKPKASAEPQPTAA